MFKNIEYVFCLCIKNKTFENPNTRNFLSTKYVYAVIQSKITNVSYISQYVYSKQLFKYKL